MRVHHLNCGTMCPRGGRLIYGDAHQRHLVCHCLLIESEQGLVLVDTGLGLVDVKRAGENGLFSWLARPMLQPSECAVNQLERRGFDPRDVQHIIITHLDLDHAGGLPDFPQAAVHVMTREYEAARTLPRRYRGRYCELHWEHEVRWRPHDEGGDRLFGFDKVVQPKGLPPEILMVPLAGHSPGHAGVAVHGETGWLLHCGDAYFHNAEVQPAGGRVPFGLQLFSGFTEVDRHQRVENVFRLRELARRRRDVTIFCSHDPKEFEHSRHQSHIQPHHERVSGGQRLQEDFRGREEGLP